MIDLVIAQLKTGPCKNVVPFGSALPSPPYLVVKEEPTALGYTRYRVIGHFVPIQVSAMRTYMKKTVYDLLDHVELTGTGTDTRRCILQSSWDLALGAVAVASSDGTLSQERVFVNPEMSY
jgi:hypothetical protein